MKWLVFAIFGPLLALTGCALLSPAEQDQTAAVAPAVPEPQAPPTATFDPDALLGADEVGVRGKLGTPAAMREQPPSTIWTYGDKGCGLDVFFFPDVQSDVLRVLSYELKVEAQGADGRAQCLRRLGVKTDA